MVSFENTPPASGIVPDTAGASNEQMIDSIFSHAAAADSSGNFLTAAIHRTTNDITARTTGKHNS